MSEYQKALENIWLDINEGVIYSTDLKRLMKDLQTLGELVDKATPKKPTGEYTMMFCPTCGKRVKSGNGSSYRARDKVCNHCFQRLKWEKDYAKGIM